MMNSIIKISLLAFMYLVFASGLFAQTTITGLVTNTVTNAHLKINYFKKEERKDSLYITTYTINDSLNKPYGTAIISFDKKKKIISVSLEHKQLNTTVKNNYLINYNDSLGLVFGLKQPFKKDPAAKSDLVLAFESSVKTYLKLSQINDNSNPKLNFSFDKLTTEDISANVKLLTPPPPPVVIKSPSYVKEIIVDSIRVILKPAMNDFISVAVFLTGGTANYPSAKAGIEPLSIEMAINGGTKNYSVASVNQLLDDTKSQINYSCHFDYSEIDFTCLKDDFNSTWNLLSDILTKPNLAPDTYTNTKQKFQEDLQNRKLDLTNTFYSNGIGNAFSTKNYDKDIFGNDYSLPKISLDDIKKFYPQLTARNRMVIVICGNVSEDDVRQKIKTTLKTLISVQGNSTASGFDIPASTMNYYSNITGNMVEGIGAAPAFGTDDFTNYMLAVKCFEMRWQNNLVDDRALVNEVSFSLSKTLQDFSQLKFSCTDPNKVVQLIFDDIKQVKKNGFTADELALAKDQLLSTTYVNQQTNLDQCLYLGDAEMLGAWQYADRLNDNIQNAGLVDVNASVKKYMKAFKFYFAGDKESANEIIFTQKLD